MTYHADADRTCRRCYWWKLRGHAADGTMYGTCWHASHHAQTFPASHGCEAWQAKVVWVRPQEANR